MATRVPITGGKEVAEFLRRYGPKFEANVMRGAMAAGAKVIRTKARENAKSIDMDPAAKKRLVRAIRHKRSRSRPGTVVAGVYVASVPSKGEDASPTDDPRVWWRWFEFGTDDRWTGSRGGKGRFRRRRRINTNKRVFRGSIKEQPFLRPAFDTAHPDALKEITDYARKRAEAEANAVAGREDMARRGYRFEGGRFVR